MKELIALGRPNSEKGEAVGERVCGKGNRVVATREA